VVSGKTLCLHGEMFKCDIFTALRFLFSTGGTSVVILAFVLAAVLLLVCLQNVHSAVIMSIFPRMGVYSR
jgi:hypothetical protein